MTFPLIDEVRELPRWAALALAARTARHVQAAFVHDWPNAPQGARESLEQCIGIAETAAAQGRLDVDEGKAIALFMKCMGFYTLAAAEGHEGAGCAAGAAAESLRVAVAAKQGDQASVTKSTISGLNHASVATGCYGHARTLAVQKQILDETLAIHERATTDRWTEGTPVPLSFWRSKKDNKPWWKVW